MGNLCSINHANFAKLHELTNNYNKATLLDKLIFWWQISKFTLNDDKIWFTRSIDQIAADAKLAKRSVERYLHAFEEAGLIEKKNILFKKKNLYIHITDKLVFLLGMPRSPAPNNKLTLEEPSPNKESLFLEQNGGIDHAKMAESIYKEKDINLTVNNNTVSQPLTVNKLTPQPKNTIQTIYPTYPIEEIIGERLTNREKNYIKGMMHNIQKQYGVCISSPEQLFSEIVFTLLNEEQLQGIDNYNHRVQIIAKLLREKRWCTPKGFYNHADFGAFFRKSIPKTDNIINRASICNSNKTNSDLRLLVKEKERLKNKFNEQCRLINTEENQLNEVAINIRCHEGSISLANSITATIISYYENQITLLHNIKQLDFLQNPKLSEYDLIKYMVRELAFHQELEKQLRKISNLSFDVFCEVSKVNPHHDEAAQAYHHYQKLSDLLTNIEKSILHIEEQIDYQYVA